MKVLIREHVEPNIFELFVAFLCVVSGVSIFLNDENALHRELNHWVIILWVISLIYSGILIIAAVVITRFNMLLGTNLHKSGLIPLSVASFVYAGAILMATGMRGLTSSIIVIMFGLSCIAKLRVLYRRTKTMETALKVGLKNERI